MYKLVLLLLNLSLASGFGPKGGGFTGGFGGSIGPGGEEGALFFLLPKKKYSAAPSHKRTSTAEWERQQQARLDAGGAGPGGAAAQAVQPSQPPAGLPLSAPPTLSRMQVRVRAARPATATPAGVR